MLTDVIDSSDYKTIKSECELKIARLEANLNDLGDKFTQSFNVKEILEKAVNNLKNLVYLYEKADIEGKRLIIGSTFPEKWTFDGAQHRTAKANQAIELIYLINNQLRHKKKPE